MLLNGTRAKIRFCSRIQLPRLNVAQGYKDQNQTLLTQDKMLLKDTTAMSDAAHGHNGKDQMDQILLIDKQAMI